MGTSLESQHAQGINRIFFFFLFMAVNFPVHTCTIKVTFAINSVLKLSHKKLSSTKLEKNRNSKVIVKFMKQFCYTQRLIAWHVKKFWAAGKARAWIPLRWGNQDPHQASNESHTQNICASDVRLFAWLMVIILKVFSHHFNSFFLFFFFLFGWVPFLLPPRAVNFAHCRAKVKVRV